MNKWYEIHLLLKDDTDTFHDLFLELIHIQPLRYIGLIFEYKDGYEEFRIMNYGVECEYSMASEDEIRAGLEYPQKKGLGVTASFCKKCNTMRVFGKKCVYCSQITKEQVNTNQLNLKEYGRKS